MSDHSIQRFVPNVTNYIECVKLKADEVLERAACSIEVINGPFINLNVEGLRRPSPWRVTRSTSKHWLPYILQVQ